MKKIVLFATVLIVGLYSCKKTTPTPSSSTNPGVKACFSVNKTLADSGEVFTFSNCSKNAAGYYWTFDGGSPSTATNPTVSYPTRGAYTVRLTATDASSKYTSDTSTTLTVGSRAITSISVTKLNVTGPTKVYFICGPASNPTQYTTDTLKNYSGGTGTVNIKPGNVKLTSANNSGWIFRAVQDNGSGPNTIITFGSASKVYPSRGPSPVDLGSTTNNAAAVNYIIVK